LLYLLFTIYFFTLAYFITKIKFVQNTGLSTKIILLLFSIKVAVGIIGGMVSHYIMNDASDVQFYTLQSLVEYDNLIHHPKVFFTDSLPSVYENGLGDFFGSSKSFWNDLRNNILIKTMGVFNIFSRGNYYINCLFFNFVGFIGHVALYRIYKHVYPKQKWAIIIGCFLLPSNLYFTSTISKDLIVFTALSIFCYCMYVGLQDIFTKKRILFLIISFFTILLIRNFIAAILLPCAIAWFVSKRYNLNPLKVFASLLIAGFIFVLLTQYLPEKYNALQVVVSKQQAFFSLGYAKSQYQNDTLQTTIKSFITAAPKALRHSFLSPYPTEFDNIYLNGFSLEIILFLLLLLFSYLYPQKNSMNHFILFGIILTALIFLFTGYITTNAGALVRYRSIYFPFIIVPILCRIHWQSIFKRTF
jgi:hypothetical protein